MVQSRYSMTCHVLLLILFGAIVMTLRLTIDTCEFAEIHSEVELELMFIGPAYHQTNPAISVFSFYVLSVETSNWRRHP
jgi:hypothetical protein